MEIKKIRTTSINDKKDTVVSKIDKVDIGKDAEMQVLNIFPDVKYQKANYFAGAVTDAAAETLCEMPEINRKEILEAYFGKDGIGYNAIRTHIDSCDFSSEQYEASSDPDDVDLENFSIEYDLKYRIPIIKEIYEISGKDIPVLLSPWSPPAFTKTNAERSHGGVLKKEFYGYWAKYIARYIYEYRKLGINVKALTIQNEPNAAQTWDSCLFTAEEEKDFLDNYLYPELSKNGLLDVHLYIWDHNKERALERAEITIDEQNIDKIEGLAFHWYTGDHFDVLRILKERYPDLQLTLSEFCVEYSRFDDNQLQHANMYAHELIGNYNAGMNNFIDWNICLNEEGGPNHVKNFCSAPVMYDRQSKKVNYNLTFDYISHFSKYIESGATVLGSSSYSKDLEQLALLNPNGEIILIVLNQADADHDIVVRIKDYENFSTTIECNSITTFVIEQLI